MGEKRYTALGCHIYAGGFTLGMRESLDVLGHVEKYALGAETARKNLGVPVVCLPDAFTNYEAHAPAAGPVDVVYGNPPCLAFSTLGAHTGMDNPVCDDWLEVVRVAKHHDPKILIIECVQQVLNKGRALIQRVVDAMPGYHPYVFLTDWALHGLPQHRRRFHLIMSRVALTFPAPEAANFGRTVAQVFADHADAIKSQVVPALCREILTRPNVYFYERFSPPSCRMRAFAEHVIRDAAGHPLPPFCCARLAADDLACTITGGVDFIHPTEWRMLSPLEQGLLQGYPADWRWPDSAAKAGAEIGKCVTSVAGRYLGRVCAAGLAANVPAPEGRDLDVTDYTPLSRKLLPTKKVKFDPAIKGALSWADVVKLKEEQTCLRLKNKT